MSITIPWNNFPGPMINYKIRSHNFKYLEEREGKDYALAAVILNTQSRRSVQDWNLTRYHFKLQEYKEVELKVIPTRMVSQPPFMSCAVTDPQRTAAWLKEEGDRRPQRLKEFHKHFPKKKFKHKQQSHCLMEAIAAVSNAAIRNGMFHFEQKAFGNVQCLLCYCQGVSYYLEMVCGLWISQLFFYFQNLLQKKVSKWQFVKRTDIIVFLLG